jgi:FAD/FMN-containing dehydrogenase
VTVGAGVTLAALQERVRAVGLQLGVDLASRQSATLGGMAATNAGGTRVLRHGTMRAQVVGSQAVLGTGQVVSQLRALPKDTSGYDVSGLLVGSEGTLGVFTALRLALDPVPAGRAAALVATPSLEAAVATAVAVQRRLPTLESAEVLDAATLELVRATFGLPPPFGDGAARWYLLLASAGPGDQDEALAAALPTDGEGTTGVTVTDAVVAGDGPRLEALWRYRESATEALAVVGPPRKLDVSVPLGALARYADAAPAALARVAPGARLHLFGHLLDGNLHCNVLDVPSPAADAADEALLRLAVELGGSIGAEHGIGRAKRRYLSLVRSPAEVAVFRAVKAALDPAGVLNPGVLLPD